MEGSCRKLKDKVSKLVAHYRQYRDALVHLCKAQVRVMRGTRQARVHACSTHRTELPCPKALGARVRQPMAGFVAPLMYD